MKHKHADSMLQYAKDAQLTDKPWELWECKSQFSSKFVPINGPILWHHTIDYRRKPDADKILDPYYELKEAQKRGDVIQVKDAGGNWYDPGCELIFNMTIDRYRIKPDDPYLHITEALEAGKLIEVKDTSGCWQRVEFIPSPPPSYCRPPDCYRIKAEEAVEGFVDGCDNPVRKMLKEAQDAGEVVEYLTKAGNEWVPNVAGGGSGNWSFTEDIARYRIVRNDPVKHLNEAQDNGKVVEYFDGKVWRPNQAGGGEFDWAFTDDLEHYRIQPETQYVYKWLYRTKGYSNWLETKRYSAEVPTDMGTDKEWQRLDNTKQEVPV